MPKRTHWVPKLILPKFPSSPRGQECLVRIVYRVDESPDLSWLEDESRYEGVSEEEAERYRREDQHRLDTYGRDWFMIGIYVELYTGEQVPGQDKPVLRSGGLWNIESDSDESYFREVEEEELRSLADEMKKAGLKCKGEVFIERVRDY